ncbi:hypothetical protein LIER_40356 [Lithospermum erythrorhizon]|uniref:Uncharacterized protein n=1 Tax=Lithospermum erythrorhizon TaxID=34254 RepID=A0AAV3QZ06_LITER
MHLVRITDLRDDKQYLSDHSESVSITTAQNVKLVFDTAIKVALRPPKLRKKQSKARTLCTFM